MVCFWVLLLVPFFSYATPQMVIDENMVEYVSLPNNKILGIFESNYQGETSAFVKIISESNAVEKEICNLNTSSYSVESLTYFDDLKRAYIVMNHKYSDASLLIEASLNDQKCTRLNNFSSDKVSQFVRVPNSPEILFSNQGNSYYGSTLYKYNVDTQKQEILFQSTLVNGFKDLKISSNGEFISYQDQLNDNSSALVARSVDGKIMHEIAKAEAGKDYEKYFKVQFCSDKKNILVATKNGFQLVDLFSGSLINNIKTEIHLFWDEALIMNSLCSHAMFVRGDSKNNLSIVNIKERKISKIIEEGSVGNIISVADDFKNIKIVEFNSIVSFDADSNGNYVQTTLVSDIDTDYPFGEVSAYALNKDKTKLWISGRNSWNSFQTLWEIDLRQPNLYKDLGLIDNRNFIWDLKVSQNESTAYFGALWGERRLFSFKLR